MANANPAPSLFAPPLLINPITGLQAQTVEEAGFLWSAASAYIKRVDKTNIPHGRLIRIEQVIFKAVAAFSYAEKSGNQRAGEIHAAFWEKLEGEKRK